MKLSKEVYELTSGIFDVSAGTLFDFWKKLINNGQVMKMPLEKELKKFTELKGFEYVELNKSESSIFIKKSGIKLDLGGIAKGYMVDKSIDDLKPGRN